VGGGGGGGVVEVMLEMVVLMAMALCSVANSSNGLKFIKKRAKNRHFESKKTGKKRAKRVLVRKRNGRLTFYLNFFHESVNNAFKPS